MVTKRATKRASEHPWQVNAWGSDPDEDNDDWWTSRGFDCEADARRAFGQDDSDRSVAYLELVGPSVRETRRNPPYFTQTAQRRREAEERADAEVWRREQATQAGQLGGVQAYNEAMGFDLECEP